LTFELSLLILFFFFSRFLSKSSFCPSSEGHFLLGLRLIDPNLADLLAAIHISIESLKSQCVDSRLKARHGSIFCSLQISLLSVSSIAFFNWKINLTAFEGEKS